MSYFWIDLNAQHWGGMHIYERLLKHAYMHGCKYPEDDA